MDVNFTDSFFKSLKNVIARERWYWKIWDFIRYDFPKFIRNIWLFRKALWNYSWWGGQHSVLPFTQIALTDIAEKVYQHGHEIESSRDKKIEKMRRTAELINHFINDDFIELAEKELGELIHHPWQFEEVPDKPGFSRLVEQETLEEQAHNRKVILRSREIEESMWAEIFYNLKGQDYSNIKSEEDWDSFFDGSGLRGWWD